jgi:hypothetical protein
MTSDDGAVSSTDPRSRRTPIDSLSDAELRRVERIWFEETYGIRGTTPEAMKDHPEIRFARKLLESRFGGVRKRVRRIAERIGEEAFASLVERAVRRLRLDSLSDSHVRRLAFALREELYFKEEGKRESEAAAKASTQFLNRVFDKLGSTGLRDVVDVMAREKPDAQFDRLVEQTR